MNKIAMLATVAALSVGAYALPTSAATVIVPNATIGTAHAITQVDCVIHVHKKWIRRHVRPDGTVVPGHWVRSRVKVCN
jgi:hypothetical protein